MPQFVGHKVKTDNPDPHPEWTKEQCIIWGSSALALFFLIWTPRIISLVGGFYGLLIILIGLLIIAVMGTLELHRVRMKKRQAQDKEENN